MYDQFSTDPKVEEEGVWLQYEGFRVRVTYAGESNKKYTKVLEAKTRPFRRAIQNGSFSNDRSIQLLMEVFAEAVILDWNVEDFVDEQIGEIVWKKGIQAKDGSVVPFSKAEVLKALKALPALFLDIKGQAESIAIFRKDDLEEDSKNS